jgi:hypothetical protein
MIRGRGKEGPRRQLIGRSVQSINQALGDIGIGFANKGKTLRMTEETASGIGTSEGAGGTL